MDERPTGDDPKSVEEWADAMLAPHRAPPPTPRGPRWYERELPRIGAIFDAVEVVVFILLVLGSFLFLHVAFNSG